MKEGRILVWDKEIGNCERDELESKEKRKDKVGSLPNLETRI